VGLVSVEECCDDLAPHWNCHPLPGSGAAVRLEAEPGSLRTYTLKHDKSDEVLPLIIAHKKALDWVLDYIWKTAAWREVKIGKKRARPFPSYGKERRRVQEIAAESIPGGLVVRGALGRLGAGDGVLHNGELEGELQQR